MTNQGEMNPTVPPELCITHHSFLFNAQHTDYSSQSAPSRHSDIPLQSRTIRLLSENFPTDFTLHRFLILKTLYSFFFDMSREKMTVSPDTVINLYGLQTLHAS